MIFGKPSYFSDKKNLPVTILERFISPYPNSSLPEMLGYHGIKEGWILDPIGNQPYSAIDLAQAGFNVFVACNNPILAKILQVLCAGYPISEFYGAIADLGALRRGQERLENQIKDLYISACPECSSERTKVKFLWKKSQPEPFAREIECLNCGFNGVVKISNEDLVNLGKIGNYQLHRTRVTQRVLPGNTNVPLAVQEVINAYLPRSLSIISTLINKLDNLDTTKDRKNIIEALLIHVFDHGNMLWGVNSGRSRPKQISIPNEFYELNLWDILEDAVSKLRILDTQIPFSFYPEIPEGKGSICFYQGRIHSLNFDAFIPEFKAIATVLPRPNQALWTFNAVWSGWIWGHETATKLKGALERRRYDWMWHTQAIRKVFEYTSSFRIPFLAVAPELTNSYILSYLSAASSSNFQLRQASYHSELKSGQFYWFPKTGTSYLPEIVNPAQSITKYLELKSEPADYQELLSIFLISKGLSNGDYFATDQLEPTLFMNTQKQFEQLVQNTILFQQVDEDKLENAEFWLSTTPKQYSPISDQIEGLFIRYAQKKLDFYSEEVSYTINQNLPGLIPASQTLIHRLISSYCVAILDQPDKWQLKPHENVSERKADFLEMVDLVHNIGERIGYKVEGQNPIEWSSDKHKISYRFFITASSIISQFSHPSEKFETVILFPGSRAEILSYKFKIDPVYAEHYKKYHFVKFRHLRTISEITNLDQIAWIRMLDSDPAVWQESNQPGLF